MAFAGRKNLHKWNLKRMNKKASMLDIVVVAVFFFIFAICCLIGGVILVKFQQFNNNTTGGSMLDGNGTKIINNLGDVYFGLWDGAAVFILVLLIIALIVSVMMVQAHPAFLWISIFLLVMFGVVFFVLQEGWKSVSEDVVFMNETNVTQQFPAINYIMGNFTKLFIIIGALTIVIMFAKFGSGWS